jgi:hypothetical protein
MPAMIFISALSWFAHAGMVADELGSDVNAGEYGSSLG